MKKICETVQDINHPGHDKLDPYRLILYFDQMCPPQQICLFYTYQNKTQTMVQKSNTNLSIYRTNPNICIEENRIGYMTQELVYLCNFINPDKYINHRSNAFTSTIMSDANIRIPLETQLAC